MDLPRMCPMNRYRLGNFEEIRFRIYTGESTSSLHQGINTFRELDTLFTFDAVNGRVWEFFSSDKGLQRSPSSGLTLVYSSGCKTAELLKLLARGQPPKETERNLPSVKPTPAELYEHFIIASLSRLSVNLARQGALLPINIDSYLIKCPNTDPTNASDEASVLRYKLVDVKLALEEDGQLFVSFHQSKYYHDQTLFNLDMDFTGARDSSQRLKCMLIPSGNAAVRSESGAPGSHNSHLRGPRWRSEVAALLATRGIVIDMGDATWTFVHFVHEPGVLFEWPSSLCFYAARPGHSGRTTYLQLNDDGQFADPLDFALSWIENKARREHDRQISSGPEGEKPKSENDFDIFGLESTSVAEYSAADGQDIYPTPSDSVPVQATPRGASLVEDTAILPSDPIDVDIVEHEPVDSRDYAYSSEQILSLDSIASTDLAPFDAATITISPDIDVMMPEATPKTEIRSMEAEDSNDAPQAASERKDASDLTADQVKSGTTQVLDRNSMRHVEFPPEVNASDRKYTSSGRFAAPPFSKRQSGHNPTSISFSSWSKGKNSESSSETSSSSSESESDSVSSLLDDFGKQTDVENYKSADSEAHAQLLAPALLKKLVFDTFAACAEFGILDDLDNEQQSKPVVLSMRDNIGLAQIIAEQLIGMTALVYGTDLSDQSLSEDLSDAVRLVAHKATLQPSDPIFDEAHAFPMDPPQIRLRRNEEDWELNSCAAGFWDTLGLEPAHGQKQVGAVCVFRHGLGLESTCSRFLQVMSETWDALRFGKHSSFSENGLEDWYTLQSVLSLAVDYEDVIIYAITPDDGLTGLATTCCSFQKFVHSNKVLTSRVANIALQRIPIRALMGTEKSVLFSQNQATALAHEVYDRLDPSEINATDSDLPILSSSSILLASPAIETIQFGLSREASSNILLERSPLHVAYSVSKDRTWIAAAWTDETGDCQHVAPYRITHDCQMEDILTEIWRTTIEIIYTRKVHWRLYISRTEAMSSVEEKTWLWLANQHSGDPPITLHLLVVDTVITLGTSAKHRTPSIVNTPAGLVSAISSPVVPSTPAGTTFGDPLLGEETDTSIRLLDKTDEAWGAILGNSMNASGSQLRYRPSLASGYIFMRTSVEEQDPPACLEVKLIAVHVSEDASEPQSLRVDKKQAEEILEEVLHMYRGLGTLARLRMQEGRDSARPWHVSVAAKTARGLETCFRELRFV